MNAEVETEAPRPRPLSGGLWTLFSWLRRDERASIESISSVGSDRTVASFAFLEPGHYSVSRAAPLLLPPQGPPSDTYKKRVRDRNLRWQHDRDITIHRKYGLYGYDAFSLPNSRRSAASANPVDRCERDRRAISESLQRRAHVPGKRRAPPPPSPPSAPTSLQRRRARKRQAPQPPVNVTQPDVISNINIGMRSMRDKKGSQPQHAEPGPSNKFEKKSKKDINIKEPKIRHEKNFLKQIFENKKRNSAIDTSTVKLLPNISELDKQAAEIIERYKLKELARTPDIRNFGNEALPGPSSSQATESWICTRCLRKYNGTVVTCTFCLPLQKNILEAANKNRFSSFTQTTEASNSPNESLEDKEKLKQMLKELKDSLHKKQNAKTSKPDVESKSNNSVSNSIGMETPTLRIGSHVTLEINQNPSEHSSSAKGFSNTNINNLKETDKLATIDNVLITQPVVLEHTKQNIVVLDENNERKPKPTLSHEDEKSKIVPSNESTNQPVTTKIVVKETKPTKNNSERENVNTKNNNTPLKVSSLLNPIYVPKPTSTTGIKPKRDNAISTEDPTTNETKLSIVMPSTSQNNVQETDIKTNLKCVTKITVDKTENLVKDKSVIQRQVNSTQTKPIEKNVASTSNLSASNIVSKLDEHSRRRELVNQLERSIAKGDEQAAAEAAIKLAKLRLTCSVLSFSSQIMSEPSTSGVKETQTKICNELTKSETPSQVPSEPSTTIIGLALIENNKIKPSVLLKDSDDKKQIPHYNNIIKEIVAEKMNSTNLKKDSEMKSTEQSGTSASSVLEPKITEKIVVNNNPITTASTSSSSNLKNDGNVEVPILIWIEDKEKTRGPVQLHIRRKATVGELRKQADKSLGLAVRMQRWIVGQTLCSDDKTPLISLAGPELKAPFYLCLVEPDSKENAKVEEVKNENIGDVYSEMVKLEKQALVTNAEVFECEVCMDEYGSGEGVVLRDCLHSFCKECLADVVKHSEEPIVTCPATSCPGILQEREIRGLVTPEDYEKWLARGLAVAESGTRNAFHCRTRDCTGWALCEPGVRRFPCPVCKHSNCVPCQAIHEGQTCKQYQEIMKEAAVSGDSGETDDDGTRALLNSLISRGEALECPECKAIITKKWGCDWVKCSACKTEICWVTRGRRWGPAGRGDTSAGCRCGVDGNKCHPSCSYCH